MLSVRESRHMKKIVCQMIDYFTVGNENVKLPSDECLKKNLYYMLYAACPSGVADDIKHNRR